MDSRYGTVRVPRGRDNLKLTSYYRYRLSGCELFDYITEKDFLEEQEATMYIRNILQAVQYLHEKNVCHLDIKVLFINVICVAPPRVVLVI